MVGGETESTDNRIFSVTSLQMFVVPTEFKQIESCDILLKVAKRFKTRVDNMDNRIKEQVASIYYMFNK